MIFRQYEAIIRKLKTETRRTSEKNTYQVGRIYSIVPKRAKPTVWYRWTLLNTLQIWHDENSYKSPLEVPLPHLWGELDTWHPLKILILSKEWEPLHDITEEDAIAEGIKSVPGHDVNGKLFKAFTHDLTRIVFFSAVDAYCDLWDMINGKSIYRWAANPAVCVHRFELVVEG